MFGIISHARNVTTTKKCGIDMIGYLARFAILWLTAGLWLLLIVAFLVVIGL